MYGVTDDEVLEMLFQHAGLRALEFAAALPNLQASPRYLALSPSNLAAWVGLLTALEVQSPAAVLAPCPAFLMVPLEEEEEGAAGEGAAGEGPALPRGPAGDGARGPPLGASGSGGGSAGRAGGGAEPWLDATCGGPAYAAACARFVCHLRDELGVAETEVFGLLSRRPSLAYSPPATMDAAIAYLAVVLKGAGRGHRLGTARRAGAAAAGSGSGPSTAASASTPSSTSYPGGAPPSSAAASSSYPYPGGEEAEMDAALIRFLRRAPGALALPRGALAAALARLSDVVESGGGRTAEGLERGRGPVGEAEGRGGSGVVGGGRSGGLGAALGGQGEEGQGEGEQGQQEEEEDQSPAALFRLLCAVPELLLAGAESGEGQGQGQGHGEGRRPLVDCVAAARRLAATGRAAGVEAARL
ncbi:hypothetical protein HYH03_017720 [Edaphochlamys debaryana]|uniref:Uncharacterized protein n=1 Tax=Edaphochlamys debaryana TaxID=47281 RepID=A0A835XII4_9CHLO|nr:hypothetical protein HYH03_017720 [Edaphochlamys debaryana]|eukprot:KAG2483413.1 hypothetical protein HYH03_017720 [Edaphochlamys debaryana]